MLLLLLPPPIFETSKSPLRKSPNLQIANPLYLCRFPDDSGRQATTDYSGLNPTLSAIAFFLRMCASSRRTKAVTCERGDENYRVNDRQPYSAGAPTNPSAIIQAMCALRRYTVPATGSYSCVAITDAWLRLLLRAGA